MAVYNEDLYAASPLDALRAGKGCRPAVYTTGGDFAAGTITFADNPTATDTITLDGVYVEFTASASDDAAAGTVGDPLLVNIKGSLALTLDEVLVVLNGTANATVAAATYTEDGVDTLTITHDTVGTAGNAFTLAASADTVSGATLSGGEDSVALALTHEHIHFTIAAAQTLNQQFTLADGDEGQSLRLYFVTKQAGNVVVTPANLTGGTTITFDAVDEFSDLYFAGGAWQQLAGSATVA